MTTEEALCLALSGWKTEEQRELMRAAHQHIYRVVDEVRKQERIAALEAELAQLKGEQK